MTPGEGGGKDRLRRAKRGYDGYLRYTGLGFTMIGIVLASTLAGRWLDGALGWKHPLATVTLSLVGIAGAMLYLFKETGRK